MANEIFLKRGTPIVWADTTDYSAVTGGYTRTAQIDLTSLGSGAARQGDKVDLQGGTSLRASAYAVHVAFEMDVAPTAGNLITVYFGGSPSSTAANANPGGLSGSDSAYSGYSSNLANSLRHLIGPFVHIVTVQIATTVQYSNLGVLRADLLDRYVMPVVYNQTDQAFEGDAVTMYVALIPLYPEVQ